MTEHAARNNMQRGTDETRERNKRTEDSPLLFSPLVCFSSLRVFSARVFYHTAGGLSTSSGSNYNHAACSVVSAFNVLYAHSVGYCVKNSRAHR